MKCDDLRDNLAAYLDGEIDGAPRRAMDSHLAECAACAGERWAQAATWTLLDRIGAAPAAPADFTARVVARVRAEGSGGGGGRLLRLRLPAAAAAAAAIVAVAGGAWLLRPGSPTGAGSGDGADPKAPPSVASVPGAASAALPPEGMLAQDLALLESLDLLRDEPGMTDLEVLEALGDLSEEDLAVLGG
jgi:hypothetical protein